MKNFLKILTIFILTASFISCAPTSSNLISDSDYIQMLKDTNVTANTGGKTSSEEVTLEKYINDLIATAEVYIGEPHKINSDTKWSIESTKGDTKTIIAYNSNIIAKFDSVLKDGSIKVDTSAIKYYNAKTKVLLDSNFQYYVMSEDLLNSFKTVANQSLHLVKDELQKIILNFDLGETNSVVPTKDDKKVLSEMLKSVSPQTTEYIVVNDVFFHNAPHSSTARNDRLVKGNIFSVSRYDNGYGYTEFINSSGTVSKGWILLDSNVTIK